MGMSPISRRTKKQKIIKDKIKKLGNFSTYMSLIKGFICTGCLYYPKAVVNGGWGFMLISMCLSCTVTMYCAKLLLETRKVTKINSYTELGYLTYGTWGKVSVDIALCLSQSGFCCAYVYFIVESLHDIIKDID